MSDEIVELTSALVAIPSFQTEAGVQALLADWLAQAGFDCRLQEVAPGRPNLIAVRGEGGPFLCSHADTQAPFDHPEPFTCLLENGRLVGRGVLDTKGQMAALVAAVRSVPDAPAVVVICCDEEYEGLGSRLVELPDSLDRTQGGIVLEPTAFRICSVQAGNLEVRLRARGEPVHMAEPEKGASALDILRAALNALDECEFMKVHHPLFPPPWSHVGAVSGGEHLWRTAGHASAEVSLSVLPGATARGARSEVDEKLRDVAALWAARGGGLEWTLPADEDLNDPIEVPRDLPAAARLGAAFGPEVAPGGMRSWTDASHLLALHRLPCVIFGAGELYPAHSDNEWVLLDDLVRLSHGLAALLRSAG